jgi:hypothetical protein
MDNSNISLKDYGNESSDYLALSYCWGTDSLFKTDAASLTSRMSNIVWGELPKTFQDVIIITRRLGRQYLWIDALCILQDDESDWQKESAKMAGIYANATATICAASSTDTNTGCLHDRYHWSQAMKFCSSALDVPVSIEEDIASFVYAVPGDLEQTIYVTIDHEHEAVNGGARFQGREEGSLLFQRGWCFQERLLSPRVLQYSRSELSWECRTRKDCECGGINRDAWVERQDNNYYLTQKVMANLEEELCHLERDPEETELHMTKGVVGSARFHALAAWRQLVKEYSGRKLSWSSDKLPALSGIVKRLMKEEYGLYCAGLWEAELPMALLWYQSDDISNTMPIGRSGIPYRAPSWSWASVDGRIDFIAGSCFNDKYGYHIDCDIKEIYCPPLGMDPTGQVSGGYIIVRGPLLRVRWARESKNYVRHSVEWSISAVIDGAHSRAAEPQFSVRSYGRTSKPEPKISGVDQLFYVKDEDADRLDQIGFPRDIFFFWIASELRLLDPLTQRLGVYGSFQVLLLKRSQREAGAYERVGAHYNIPFGRGVRELTRTTTIKIV